MNKVTELDINEVDEQELEAQLPRPVGYRILIAMPEIEETYTNTKVLKTTTAIHQEHIMSIIGLVLDMGDQAYSDVERFGDKPWCEVGDYVMFRANTGTRFKVGGIEYRLMNDDSIEAVVSDPRGVSRA